MMVVCDKCGTADGTVEEDKTIKVKYPFWKCEACRKITATHEYKYTAGLRLWIHAVDEDEASERILYAVSKLSDYGIRHDFIDTLELHLVDGERPNEEK